MDRLRGNDRRDPGSSSASGAGTDHLQVSIPAGALLDGTIADAHSVSSEVHDDPPETKQAMPYRENGTVLMPATPEQVASAKKGMTKLLLDLHNRSVSR